MSDFNVPVDILKFTLQFEGGWTDNPADPGGKTMKGVTFKTFKSFFPGSTVAQLKAITTAQLGYIYDVGYWRPVNGSILPPGVNMVMFDIAVNSGPGRANGWYKAMPAGLDPKAQVNWLCDRREAFWKGLKTFNTFGKGWMSRGAACRKAALAMTKI